jgi:hypothetical protein
MKRGFSLIEVLIGVFVLALALLGVAAVFAATTRQIAQQREEIMAQIARRNAEALQPNVAVELIEGWNLQQIMSTVDGIEIYCATFVSDTPPPIRVMIAIRSGGELQIVDSNIYVPVNGDVVVSWYGFHSVVRDDRLFNQPFEREKPYLVIPYEKSQMLDVHRMDNIRPFLNK